jgi:lysozyme
MPTNKQKAVAGGLGAALLIATPLIMKWEGTVYKGYVDPIGIATKCTGDTNDVVVGKAYTKEQCEKSLSDQIAAHSAPVLKCTPGLADHPYQLAAAISLTYNIGSGAYCRSSVARRFNQGDFIRACNNFLAWDRAGGKVLRGLQNRRRDERRICLTGLV